MIRFGSTTCLITTIFIILVLIQLGAQATQRPNFLIILADDGTYRDLPLHGGRNAKTPDIDRLALQAMVIN